MLSKFIRSTSSKSLPLHQAASHNKSAIIEGLIEQGTAVDTVDPETGNTALIVAATHGHKKIVSLLLSAGASPTVKNKEGISARSIARKSHDYELKYILDRDGVISGFFAAIKSEDINLVTILLSKYPSAIGWSMIQDSENIPVLSYAAMLGVSDIAMKLLKAGANAQSRQQPSGLTPLNVCTMVAEPSLGLIHALVSAGGDVNARAAGVKGVSPLHLAASGGHVSVARALIDAGADIDLPDTSSALGWTPLMYAANRGNLEVVKALISAGSNLNAQHNTKGTALHEAARLGRLDIVQCLVENGAHVNVVDDSLRNPLHFTNHFGFFHVSKYLLQLENADVDAIIHGRDIHGNTPMHVIMDCEDDEAYNEIIELSNVTDIDFDAPDNHGRTVLMSSINEGKPVARILPLIKVCNPSCVDSRKQNALTLACKVCAPVIVIRALIDVSHENEINHVDDDKSSPLHYAVDNGSLETVELLLKGGADCSLRDEDSFTPLHLGIHGAFNDICSTLIAHCKVEDLDIKDKEEEWTPLHLACSFGLEEIARELITKGCDVNTTDKNGRTPLFCAAVHGYYGIVKDLLECTGTLNSSNGDIIEYDYDYVNLRDFAGLSVLHVAGGSGNPEVVQLLIDAGADVNASDSEGSSVLYDVVATALQFDLVNEKRILEVVDILLKGKADVNEICHGLVPLHWASIKGDEDIARLLLDAGADPLAMTEDGETPAELAAKNGHDSEFWRNIDV